MLSIKRFDDSQGKATPETDNRVDNEALWEKLRQGQQKAIEDLYRFNYQVLYSYSYKISKDKELSKDCVQELFVSLWEKRNKLGKVVKVRPYLLQSIWHLVIKKLKKQSRNISLDENDHYDIEVVFPNEKSMIDDQEREISKSSLLNAIDTLSTRQKQIIFMQYYEGLTIDEIRQITELKYQSIKNLTHRAMLALRAHYKFKEK
jgi:RNA polymerase sigma factor (sigma-70 family)